MPNRKDSLFCQTASSVRVTTARHPNLVALELSSFKCGHGAPIYSNIEDIIERSGTPYFCFKDIDENKPTGAIRIRIETIVLKRYREKMIADKQKRAAIEAHLATLADALQASLRLTAPAAAEWVQQARAERQAFGQRS